MTDNTTALDQQLARDSPVAGSERGTDCELARASGRAHQKKVGDVDAGDQQNDEHARLQQVERQPHVAHELLAKTCRDAGKAAVTHVRGAAGHPIHQAVHDRLHLRVQLLDRSRPGRSRPIIRLNSLPRSSSDRCGRA